jgi:hypothetical protein
VAYSWILAHHRTNVLRGALAVDQLLQNGGLVRCEAIRQAFEGIVVLSHEGSPVLGDVKVRRPIVGFVDLLPASKHSHTYGTVGFEGGVLGIG